jgi:uncharacterized OB-fold protein
MTDSTSSKVPAAEAQPFWDAAARGVLLLKRCVETGKCFYYPREASPFTGGPTEWVEASGFGEIYSCSVAYRAQPPYCIAYVRLDEGPIVLSNIEAQDLSKIAIGQRVRALFRDVGDRKAPFFMPAS